jgi:hypothetical protein
MDSFFYYYIFRILVYSLLQVIICKLFFNYFNPKTLLRIAHFKKVNAID